MNNPFYCSTCNVHFSDSFAAAAHRASIKHKKKTGEYESEIRQYKKDSDVTVADIDEIVERKRKELNIIPWSQLRWQPQNNDSKNETNKKLEFGNRQQD